jgi:DNA primase
MEDTVVNEATETAADDALNESLPEEQDASEPIESALEERQEDSQQAADSADGNDSASSRKEPGYIKQRIEKAVSRAIAETEQRIAAEYERRFAPLMEKMLDAEARELVRQGEFKNLDRAKEYLQLKQGAEAKKAEKPQQARDDRGPSAQQQESGDGTIDVRASMLAKQAEKIQSRRGLDVMAEFNNNEETRQKILSGEWDFYDVADSMDASKSGQKKSTPSVMRSPNGASGSEKSSIATMSDEQFERLEKNISEGRRYSL